jgi:hypothetical protein
MILTKADIVEKQAKDIGYTNHQARGISIAENIITRHCTPLSGKIKPIYESTSP